MLWRAKGVPQIFVDGEVHRPIVFRGAPAADGILNGAGAVIRHHISFHPKARPKRLGNFFSSKPSVLLSPTQATCSGVVCAGASSISSVSSVLFFAMAFSPAIAETASETFQSQPAKKRDTQANNTDQRKYFSHLQTFLYL